jgi:hypothetical protein
MMTIYILQSRKVRKMKDLHSIEEVDHFVNDHQFSFIYVLNQS